MCEFRCSVYLTFQPEFLINNLYLTCLKFKQFSSFYQAWSTSSLYRYHDHVIYYPSQNTFGSGMGCLTNYSSKMGINQRLSQTNWSPQWKLKIIIIPVTQTRTFGVIDSWFTELIWNLHPKLPMFLLLICSLSSSFSSLLSIMLISIIMSLSCRLQRNLLAKNTFQDKFNFLLPSHLLQTGGNCQEKFVSLCWMGPLYSFMVAGFSWISNVVWQFYHIS